MEFFQSLDSQSMYMYPRWHDADTEHIFIFFLFSSFFNIFHNFPHFCIFFTMFLHFHRFRHFSLFFFFFHFSVLFIFLDFFIFSIFFHCSSFVGGFYGAQTILLRCLTIDFRALMSVDGCSST